MKTTLAAPTVAEQIIVFADLQGYHRRICSKLRPEENFEFLAEYYAIAQRLLEDSNGRMVKLMGDAMLLLFPAEHPREAIAALERMKTAIDSFLVEKGFDTRLRIKAHLGVVASGTIGSGEWERFDVCGIAVNEAALLPDGEWVISVELQRRENA